MERDKIIIRSAIMHILNTNNNHLEFSDTLLDLTTDKYDFIRNHIYKIMDSDDSTECTFTDDSEIRQLMEAFEETNLIMDSQMLAYKLYEIMAMSFSIPPADLFVVPFQEAGTKYLAILKMNYKESYVHKVEKYNSGISNTIAKQKVTLPSLSAKLTEAAVINLRSLKINLIEKKYDINGVKENYFSSKFLQCTPQLSTKAKLNLVSRAMDKIKRKYYPEDYNKIMEYKSLVYQSNLDGEIIPEDIVDDMFPEESEIKQEFIEDLDKNNLTRDSITPKKPATVKKFEQQQLTTDQGIIISIPMKQYLNNNNVIIKHAPDGTMEITIKDIESITAR